MRLHINFFSRHGYIIKPRFYVNRENSLAPPPLKRWYYLSDSLVTCLFDQAKRLSTSFGCRTESVTQKLNSIMHYTDRPVNTTASFLRLLFCAPKKLKAAPTFSFRKNWFRGGGGSSKAHTAHGSSVLVF